MFRVECPNVGYKVEEHLSSSFSKIDDQDNENQTNVVIPDSEEDIEEVAPLADFTPSLEDRNAFLVGYCPAGQVRRSGYCVDSDYNFFFYDLCNK
ncbi:unnamed protein product [Arctia plantaginis]|uniref:Uncharacterized protein n=1 Tax=Arctia plantaginis TaxID=874455 RepID=A0A8S1ARR9_ARCPL|nr:unnamed protein product [Arctia plantaginis]